ncbi:MAG TPA: hypothetical protein PKD55_00070 [Bellilinea sp.]|nr:hypothetical protein [Bellilinea sp.]
MEKLTFRELSDGSVVTIEHNERTGSGWRVWVTTPDGFCDSPVVYDEGLMAYDFPERLSEELKDAAHDACEAAGLFEKATLRRVICDLLECVQDYHDSSAHTPLLQNRLAELIEQVHKDTGIRLYR